MGQAQEKPEGRGKQRWEQPPFLEPHLLKPGDKREREAWVWTPCLEYCLNLTKFLVPDFRLF